MSQLSILDLPGYWVTELGKVHTLHRDGKGNWVRGALGSAGTTNTDPGIVCPCCGVTKAKKRNVAWLYWPLVGFCCYDCSRAAHDSLPYEPLFVGNDGVRLALTRPA